MINTERQAFLIVTNILSKEVIQRYYKLKKATAALGDVFLLCHIKDNTKLIVYKDVKIETFTNSILNDLGYKPIRKSLVPGSNHFPVLDFYLKHGQYTHYWCFEDDVAFSGKWEFFFENVSSRLNYDFITSHIRRYTDMPYWFWWRTLTIPQGEFNKEEMLNSFNPAYRISNKALQYLDNCLKNGYSGHHEVLLPSLLHKAGFKIADFGEKNNYVTPSLSFCTLTTMRWKPVFFMPGFKKNKLYHPVKAKITFKHILLFIKRTLYNQTEYFK